MECKILIISKEIIILFLQNSMYHFITISKTYIECIIIIFLNEKINSIFREELTVRIVQTVLYKDSQVVQKIR